MSQASSSASPAIAIVAEDEVLVRLVTVDMLEEAGFDVIEAGDAKTALEHLARHPRVTLLFTDIEMPGPMNGIELAQEAARRWPMISVVVCSGRVRPLEGALPERARFISKPYSHAHVREILAEKGLI